MSETARDACDWEIESSLAAPEKLCNLATREKILSWAVSTCEGLRNKAR
jgi:hypothetical protein